MAGKKKYRVAVVGGAGNWGTWYMRTYSRHPECEIIALVDTARERRKLFANYYGIERVYDRVEDLLSEDIPDIVSAPLPVSVAHGVVLTCVEAGVRVVSCEKPISENLAKVDEIVQVCREKGIPLGCGTAMWEVLYLKEICDWVQAGNIGELTAAASNSLSVYSDAEASVRTASNITSPPVGHHQFE